MWVDREGVIVQNVVDDFFFLLVLLFVNYMSLVCYTGI